MDNASSTMMKGSRLENRVLMHPHLSLKALISLFLPPSLSLSPIHPYIFVEATSYIAIAISLTLSIYLHPNISAPNKLSSIPLSKISLHAPTGFMPCMSHMSVHHPYLCEHSPSNSFSNLLVNYHHSPQHLTHIIHPQCTTSSAGSSLEHLFCNSLRPADLPCFIFPIALTTLPIDPFTRPKHWTYIGQNQFCPK